MPKENDGWGDDNWIYFITSAVADLINDGSGSTSVLHNNETNSVVITLADIDIDDPRLPQKFVDLMGKR